MIQRTHNFLQWAFAIFVIYLLLTRLVISWVQFFPNQFSTVVNAVSGYSIQFESAQLNQHWLGFELDVTNLKIESEQTSFEAERLAFDLNTFYYFIPRADYGDYLILNNGAFQNKAAASSVDAKEDEKNNASFISELDLAKLLKVDANLNSLWKRVKVEDFVLSELKPGLTLHIHDFQSLKSSRLTFTSEFSLSYADVLNYERFNLKSSFNPNVWGDIDSGRFSVTSFKPLNAQKVAKLLPVKWQEVTPNGEIILDLQGELANAQLANLGLSFNSQALNWPQKAQDLPQSLGFLLEWKREQENIERNLLDWQFTLAKIQINNRFIESASPIQMSFEGNNQLYFNAAKFDIEPFKVIVNALLRKELATKLFDRAVNLSVSDFKGRLNWQTLDLPSFNIQFERLDLPVTDYPGLSLKDFSVNKDLDQITIIAKQPLMLESSAFTKKVLKVSLPERFTLNFNKTQQAWVLPETAFQLNDVKAKLSINQINNLGLNAQLNASFKSMEQLKTYLPYSIMSEKLQAWLKQGLVDGKDIDVVARTNGSFKNFPYQKPADASEFFEVNAKVKDAKLNFNSEWPMLSNFDANVSFKPYEISIDVAKLDIGKGNTAKNVTVTIPELNKSDIGLSVTGQVDSSLNKTINYLTASPVASKVGIQKFLNSSTGYAGKANINIKRIWVPISGYDEREPLVDGVVQFENAALNILDVLPFTSINGTLAFSDKAVSSQKLAFKTLQGSGELQLATNTKNKVINLTAAGAALNQENEWFAKKLNWSTSLDIPFKSSSKGLSLKSQFDVGSASSKLPYPYSAQSLQTKQLLIDADISNNRIQANINLPDMAKTHLVWNKVRSEYSLDLMQAIIGGAAYRQLDFEAKGSYIRGKLDAVNLNEWSNLSFKWPFNKSSTQSESLNWQRSELNFEQLHYLGSVYKDTEISWLTKKEQPLVVYVKNDGLDANIQFNQGNHLDLNVNRFNLNTATSNTTNQSESAQKKSESTCDVKNGKEPLPDINFVGENIVIDGRKINQLRFAIREDSDRLTFKPITGSFGDGAGEIKGQYLYDKAAKQSFIKAELSSNKVEAITKFIKTDKGFTGKKGEVDLELNWQGNFQCFNTANTKGNLKFELKDGSIEDVEPGIARLIGLLSVDSLIRRLKLDLKDVTNKGLIYDTIKGKADINDNKVTLSKMELKAPSADAKLTGTIDLAKKQFDIKANLTPKVGSTIPTIAALAGSTNPLAALAVYTVLKILPDVNENLITYQYTVKGPWENPVINEKGSNQDSKEDKKQNNNLHDFLNNQ